MQGVIGVILGGGKGTRLFPLTQIRAKPAVPFGGKYRLVDIPISNCINSQINQVFVLTQFNSESLNRHIAQTYRFGLFSRGFVDILAAEQTLYHSDWFQGTADAVRRSLHHILNSGADNILILSGDQLYRMDYRKLLDHHIYRGADCTVCAIPIEPLEADRFGILKLDEEGRIRSFHEKPTGSELVEKLKVGRQYWADPGREGRPLLASMGIYVFKTDVLVQALDDEAQIDFGRDVIPSCLDRFLVYGYVFGGYWEDIGTIGAFYKANLDLATENPLFELFDSDEPIYTHPRFLPASRVSGCQLNNSVVAEGCTMTGSRIENSVVGIRSRVRNATLINTLMMGADYYDLSEALGVGPGCVIENAIIDKNAKIGSGVQILQRERPSSQDADSYYIRDGIVVITKNAVIPSDTII